jgi:hypothetical protein
MTTQTGADIHRTRRPIKQTAADIPTTNGMSMQTVIKTQVLADIVLQNHYSRPVL